MSAEIIGGLPVTEPIDADISTRNRWGRNFVLISYVIVTYLACVKFTTWLGAQIFPDQTMVGSIAFILGSSIAVFILITTISKYFIIRNPTVGMFVTQNTLATLLGLKDDVNISYGPGTHICYPWERRLRENNVSLEEATNNFTFAVQCSDGWVTGKGSYRLRPDQGKPVTFLSGVGAVADEVKDLIISDIIEFIQEKGVTVKEALQMLGQINKHLIKKFRDESHEVEKWFGVIATDVTVSNLEPSAEVQRSISAMAEATAISRGVEILLGLSQREIAERIERGLMSQADVNLARDRFLSISGNLEGMQINRQEYDISLHGLDPEALKAIADLAKTPGVQAALAAAGRRRSGPKPKKGTSS